MYPILRTGISEPPRKSRKKSPLRLRCYICNRERVAGKDPQFTYDHVVPVQLFQPRGTDRYPAKMWQCPECKTVKDQDEDYILAHFAATGWKPSALDGVQNLMESYSQGNRQGLVHSIIGGIEPARVFSPVYGDMGTLGKLTVDRRRFDSFMQNITKGMWTAYINRHLNWEDYVFQTKYIHILDSINSVFNPFIEMYTLQENWEEYFFYRAHYIEDTISWWFFVFHDSHLGVVVSHHKDYRERIKLGGIATPIIPQDLY